MYSLHFIEVWGPSGTELRGVFRMSDATLLKKDLFGEVHHRAGAGTILRDTGPASAWIAWLARALMRREANVLAALDGFEGVPQIVSNSGTTLERSYIEGRPMQEARPENPDYFRAAAQLLRRLHARGVVHNDLAKEPNLLVTDLGEPAFLDFQLGWAPRRRSRLFRALAYEDIRHLLKHKRTYCPESLTTREKSILSRPSVPSRMWRSTVKPVYLFVTRRLLGWADREGAGDRGRQG